MAVTVGAATQQRPAANPNLTPAPVSNNAFGNVGGVGAGTQTAAAANPFYSPQAASTPYQFSNFQTNNAGNQVQLGTVMAQILGLAPGSYPMSTLLQHYEDLDQTQMGRLQSQLYNGGFYIVSGGQPGMAPNLGQHDDQTFNAFANALMGAIQTQASQPAGSQTTLDSYVDQAISRGGGVAQLSQGQAITGGGAINTYDLSNPTNVAYTAHTIFQAALGRDPTAAELSKATAALQAAQTTYAGQQTAAANLQGQQQYQQKVAGVQAALAPVAPVGPVPNGPFSDAGQWSTALLQYMGLQVTASNVATVMGLVNSVGLGLGDNNPLGVTLVRPGSTETKGGTMPSAQKYQTAADGIQAAAQTLLGHYPLLMQELTSGKAQADLANPAVQGEIAQLTGGSGDITKQAQAAQDGANAAVKKYTPPAPATPATGAPAPATPWLSGTNARNLTGGPLPVAAPPAPAQSATTTPWGTQIPGAATPPASANMLTPQQMQTQQGPIPAGSSYIPDTSQGVPALPTESGYLWQQATTGANQIPYEGYQYLQAFNAIMSMVHANVTQGA